MRRKKTKYGSTYLQGQVLRARKWERIEDCPLHRNSKIVTLQIRHDILENSRTIQVEKKDIPINNIKNSCEIKNGYYLIFPMFVLEGDLWGARGDQRNKNIPHNVSKNKVHLVLMIDLHTSGKR